MIAWTKPISIRAGYVASSRRAVAEVVAAKWKSCWAKGIIGLKLARTKIISVLILFKTSKAVVAVAAVEKFRPPAANVRLMPIRRGCIKLCQRELETQTDGEGDRWIEEAWAWQWVATAKHLAISHADYAIPFNLWLQTSYEIFGNGLTQQHKQTKANPKCRMWGAKNKQTSNKAHLKWMWLTGRGPWGVGGSKHINGKTM